MAGRCLGASLGAALVSLQHGGWFSPRDLNRSHNISCDLALAVTGHPFGSVLLVKLYVFTGE